MKKFSVLIVALLCTGIVAAQPVNDQVLIDVDGTDIYLDIEVTNADAPVVLYLHGGPGNAALGITPFKSNVGPQLHDEFTIAYVHQRGAGRSPAVPDSELTITAHVNDVAMIVDYLTSRFGRERVHLIGHSWGGMLALLYTERHLQRVESLVLIASPVNMKETYQDSYENTLRWAQEVDALEAVKQLSELDLEDASIENRRILNRWANQANGGIAGQFDMGSIIQRYNINDQFPDWAEQQSNISRVMMPQLTGLDLSNVISMSEIPALFVAGSLDSIVPEKAVRRSYDNYNGPKSIVVLENSHHLPFIDRPSELSQAIDIFLSSLL